MINSKKKQNSEFDLSKFDAVLNFAYCPSIALTIEQPTINNTQEFKELSDSLDDKSTHYMSLAMKYFYICYSITIENINLEDNNYFYFQLFSQIGDQQTAADPIYGFYNDEKILESIKDIDSMFYPDQYDKQIFDTFQDELFGKADEIIKLMQQWTELKLLSFNNLYFKDKSVVDNLYKLIDYNLKKNAKVADVKTTRKTRSPISKKPKQKPKQKVKLPSKLKK